MVHLRDRSRRRAAVVSVTAPVLAALAVMLVAGCGGSSGAGSRSTGSAAPAATDPAVATSVPAAIRSKGTLSIASDATYAPNEFIAADGHTIEGADIDLVTAMARVMGLKASVVNTPFDSIIPGLAAGKYDLGMSSFTDTKAREKVVDFVTYFSAGTSFFVKTQGGPAINGLSSLCGKTVAVQKGTVQETDASAQSAKCTKTGSSAVHVLVFPGQNDANLAVSSGRAQVGMSDSPVVAYQVKRSNGQFKLVGPTYGAAPYGIAIPKSTGLTRPILAAVKKVMADGVYMSILEKWGVQAGAIQHPTINGATS